MKPKDLKSPYPWSERCPLLKEKIFYVPDYYENHQEFTLPPWEDKVLFGRKKPIHLEYCSGNGDWILAKAKKYPDINWVAVEKKFERVRKIQSKKTNYGIENLVIISGEGLTFTKEYLQENSVEAVYVNFPDPWPKDRHAKHRLIQKPFVEEMSRILVDKGTMTLVTDHTLYMEQMREAVEKEQIFHPLICDKEIEKEYGNSFFEILWRSKGREINFLKYENILCPAT